MIDTHREKHLQHRYRRQSQPQDDRNQSQIFSEQYIPPTNWSQNEIPKPTSIELLKQLASTSSSAPAPAKP